MSLLATIKRALFGKNLTMKRATAIADQIRAKSDGAAYDQPPRFTFTTGKPYFTTPVDLPKVPTSDFEVTGAPGHIRITNILTWEKLVDAYLSQGAEDFPNLVKPRAQNDILRDTIRNNLLLAKTEIRNYAHGDESSLLRALARIDSIMEMVK